MEYILLYLAGGASAASGLLIWYYSYVTVLRKERHAVKEQGDRLSSQSFALTQQFAEMEKSRRLFDDAMVTFNARKVQYDDLLRENNGLKQDLFNLSLKSRKMERDQAAIARRQEEIDQRTNELANRYLKENVSWIASKLTANNFSSSKQRLLDVIGGCRGIGFDVPQDKEEELVQDLKNKFEELVRAQFDREEQSRIRAQIREDERLKREMDKQIQDAEREQAAIKAALEKTLQRVHDEHNAEVEALRVKLKEAEERTQRAKSMAEMTKAGYVYVISNIGSFGEGVYKIGMTRRLEPMDRVKELGDASVPFPFDVHMMVSCEDAPALENALHREFHKLRINKVNFRKEFFRVDLETIRKIVEANHGVVDYVAEPAALDYRESINMKDEDYEFIERTVEPLVGENGSLVDD